MSQEAKDRSHEKARPGLLQLRRSYVTPLVKIHVVEGRYDQANIAKASSAINITCDGEQT
jgi:hypothetical protein